MAKLKGIFKYEGTFDGVTAVNSRAYGQHLRKARTKFTLGKEMMESSAMLTQANVYAKVFKDAIDPYRRDFYDGMLWKRLVSLFKTQLKENGTADFSVLEGHGLNKKHPLSRLFGVQTTVSQTERTLNVQVISRQSQDPTNGRADGYLQTFIIIFMDDDLQAQSFSSSEQVSLTADPSERQVHFTVPEAATVAILVMKYNLSSGNTPMGLQKGMGMSVEKVLVMK